MPFDRFMIAPLNEGLQTDVRPWLISDEAWAQLNNVYVWRGRVRKRTGTRLLNGTVAAVNAQLNSRLRVDIGTTDGAGNIAVVVPGAIFKIGQQFSIGTEVFTVVVLGLPGVMLISGAATLATYNTTTGAVVINGAAVTTTVYFYPSEPVMGFIIPEDQLVNDEGLFAFDTQFAYQFTGGGWERLALENAVGDATWTGSNAQFFGGTNFRGIPGANLNPTFLFVTNFNAAEANFMRYNVLSTLTWNTFEPTINTPAAAPTSRIRVKTARLIIGFQNRILLFNTVETTTPLPSPPGVEGPQTTFQNRLRFSRLTGPLGADSFTAFDGTDSFVIDNLQTTEAIIGAEFIKNRLIVFFERSTWELVYTGNDQGPFRWQQINTELGVESTFSVIPFDKVVMGIGNTGVHACNGANVERIDHKIPDLVFEIHNENDGVFRVHGIRDYFKEIVYWTFPDQDPNPTFPTRLLVYNYKNGSWSIFDDSITAFGYFQNREDRTWGSTNETWQSTEWTWGTASQQGRFRQVIGGNQEGFTFILDETDQDPSLQITNIAVSVAPNIIALTIIDHNLDAQKFIKIEHALGVTVLNGLVFPVNTVIDANTITVDIGILVFAGTYTGQGVVSRVSQINMRTKQFNFYAKEGRNAIVEKVDFLVDKSVGGEITVNFYISTGAPSMVSEGTISGALIGTSILDLDAYTLIPFEDVQSRVWHPLYFQAEGEVIQLQLIHSAEQLTSTANPSPAFSDFELHALTFYARPSGRLQ